MLEMRNPFKLGLLDLPESSDSRVRQLSAVFNKKTNIYKYYWFLAVLESIKNGYVRPSLDLLTAEMIAQAWYPVIVCHLNFGLQDELGNLIYLLKNLKGIAEKTKREDIRNTSILLAQQSLEFQKKFRQAQRFVPQRLLTPWFEKELSGMPDHQKDKYIQYLANSHYENRENPPLYKFWSVEKDKGIEIHPYWVNYLSQNFRIIRAFTLWYMLEFLQQRNSYVPNLQEKLFPPQERDMRNAHKYWDWILKQEKMICPFSEEPIPIDGYSLDHFLPWSFVGHDQIWNLFPISKSVNSSKSDKLPKLSKYLEPFTLRQYQALQVFLSRSESTQSRVMDDYINLFRCDYETLKSLSLQSFSQYFEDTFVPLEQMAANMGFFRGWEYHLIL